jgi:DNA-directed RNA polymerase specialized sigma24 family protein
MRDQQGFTDFASARAGDLRRQAYLLTGSPERAVRLADKALAETGRRWDRLGGAVAAEEHARRVVAVGSLRGRGVTPMVALTARGTAAPTDDAGEAVRRALAGLPPRRRAVLVLRYDEGLDDAAVGARLGMPPATAAAEGEAGLVTLRSLLRRRGRPEDLLATALAQTPLPTPLAPADPPAAAGTPADPAASGISGGPSASGATAEAGAPAAAAPERDSVAETGARDAGASAATAPPAADAGSNGGPAPAVDARSAGAASSTGAAATSSSAPQTRGPASTAGAAAAKAGGDAASAKVGDAASATVDADAASANPGSPAPARTDRGAGSAPAGGAASAEAGGGAAAAEAGGDAGSAPAGRGAAAAVQGGAAAAEAGGDVGSAPAGRGAAAAVQGGAAAANASVASRPTGGRQNGGSPASRPAAGARNAGGAGAPTAGRPSSRKPGGSPVRNSAGATTQPAGAARAVPVKTDGAGSATAAAGTAPQQRRRWLVAAVVIVVVGIGAAILVPALRGDSASDGPVPAATGSGHAQLPWAVRGPLAGDQDLLRSALRAWQSGVPDRQRPAQAAALWAGDLDGVRTVLLQGTDATGQTWVAHVIGSGDTASLRSTEPLGRAVPLLAVGTSAGAVRLLADPDAPPNSILAGVSDTFRPLAVAQDSLTQGVTVPPTGLRVVLTDGEAVLRSGTVLPGRLSPVTGAVELTRSTLDLGPAQPPVQAWYDDGQLIGSRLGGPVDLVQVGPARTASVRVAGRPAKLEVRGYEVVRGGTRYLATVVRAGGAPTCTDTATVGPADSVPAKPVALVARCIPRGSADGVVAAVGTRGVRSVLVTLAPAAPAVPGRPGLAPRPARPARTVTVTGTSGSGLVGLSPVTGMPTSPVPAAARDAGNHQLAGVMLPAYTAPRP